MSSNSPDSRYAQRLLGARAAPSINTDPCGRQVAAIRVPRPAGGLAAQIPTHTLRQHSSVIPNNTGINVLYNLYVYIYGSMNGWLE